ncbi:MAG: polysaccharide deacetylase family protein, partial [Lachnospiraceae bacterium]|nr:polysaccharide deacetylase family protein [Lachnospiraceae bacterium]
PSETEPTETEPPETLPPVTEPPETLPPVTEPPETLPPVTEPPETLPPVTEPPETLPPETQPAVPHVHYELPPEGMEGLIAGVDYGQYLPVPEDVRATSAFLSYQKYGAFYTGDTSKPVIYLTFTVATENGDTRSILNVLNSRGVKAVFFISLNDFLLSNGVDTVALLRDIIAGGHIIGCHGFTHTRTTTMSDVRFVNEILMFRSRLYDVLGYDYDLRLYCPPHEEAVSRDVYLSGVMGLRYVMATGLYMDLGDDYTAEKAFADMTSRLRNGFVYLLHSKPANAAALGAFIDTARSMGYSFGTP